MYGKENLMKEIAITPKYKTGLFQEFQDQKEESNLNNLDKKTFNTGLLIIGFIIVIYLSIGAIYLYNEYTKYTFPIIFIFFSIIDFCLLITCLKIDYLNKYYKTLKLLKFFLNCIAFYLYLMIIVIYEEDSKYVSISRHFAVQFLLLHFQYIYLLKQWSRYLCSFIFTGYLVILIISETTIYNLIVTYSKYGSAFELSKTCNTLFDYRSYNDKTLNIPYDFSKDDKSSLKTLKYLLETYLLVSSRDDDLKESILTTNPYVVNFLDVILMDLIQLAISGNDTLKKTDPDFRFSYSSKLDTNSSINSFCNKSDIKTLTFSENKASNNKSALLNKKKFPKQKISYSNSYNSSKRIYNSTVYEFNNDTNLNVNKTKNNSDVKDTFLRYLVSVDDEVKNNLYALFDEYESILDKYDISAEEVIAVAYQYQDTDTMLYLFLSTILGTSNLDLTPDNIDYVETFYKELFTKETNITFECLKRIYPDVVTLRMELSNDTIFNISSSVNYTALIPEIVICLCYPILFYISNLFIHYRREFYIKVKNNELMMSYFDQLINNMQTHFVSFIDGRVLFYNENFKRSVPDLNLTINKQTGNLDKNNAIEINNKMTDEKNNNNFNKKLERNNTEEYNDIEIINENDHVENNKIIRQPSQVDYKYLNNNSIRNDNNLVELNDFGHDGNINNKHNQHINVSNKSSDINSDEHDINIFRESKNINHINSKATEKNKNKNNCTFHNISNSKVFLNRNLKDLNNNDNANEGDLMKNNLRSYREPNHVGNPFKINLNENELKGNNIITTEQDLININNNNENKENNDNNKESNQFNNIIIDDKQTSNMLGNNLHTKISRKDLENQNKAIIKYLKQFNQVIESKDINKEKIDLLKIIESEVYADKHCSSQIYGSNFNNNKNNSTYIINKDASPKRLSNNYNSKSSSSCKSSAEFEYLGLFSAVVDTSSSDNNRGCRDNNNITNTNKHQSVTTNTNIYNSNLLQTQEKQEDIVELKFFKVFIRKFYHKSDKFIIDLMIDDITESYKAEKIEKISFETKLKQKLFSKMAHEFKTPLIIIRSLICDLCDLNNSNPDDSNNNNSSSNNINETKNKISKYIYYLSDYISFLINDIIYYSNNSDIKVQVENVDIIEMMEFFEGVTESLLAVMPGNKCNITVIKEIEDDINNFIVKSDKIRLKQIILNLISNSVKFTKHGHIRLFAGIKKQEICSKCNNIVFDGFKNKTKHYTSSSISNNSNNNSYINNLKLLEDSKGFNINMNNSNKDDENKENDRCKCLTENNSVNNNNTENTRFLIIKYSLLLQVEDTGIGITEQDLKKIFCQEDKILSINTDYSYNQMGTGLGLSIVKSIASRISHSLKIKSIYGKGSIFILEIPDIEYIEKKRKSNPTIANSVLVENNELKFKAKRKKAMKPSSCNISRIGKELSTTPISRYNQIYSINRRRRQNSSTLKLEINDLDCLGNLDKLKEDQDDTKIIPFNKKSSMMNYIGNINKNNNMNSNNLSCTSNNSNTIPLFYSNLYNNRICNKKQTTPIVLDYKSSINVDINKSNLKSKSYNNSEKKNNNSYNFSNINNINNFTDLHQEYNELINKKIALNNNFYTNNKSKYYNTTNNYNSFISMNLYSFNSMKKISNPYNHIKSRLKSRKNNIMIKNLKNPTFSNLMYSSGLVRNNFDTDKLNTKSSPGYNIKDRMKTRSLSESYGQFDKNIIFNNEYNQDSLENKENNYKEYFENQNEIGSIKLKNNFTFKDIPQSSTVISNDINNEDNYMINFISNDNNTKPSLFNINNNYSNNECSDEFPNKRYKTTKFVSSHIKNKDDSEDNDSPKSLISLVSNNYLKPENSEKQRKFKFNYDKNASTCFNKLVNNNKNSINSVNNIKNNEDNLTKSSTNYCKTSNLNNKIVSETGIPYDSLNIYSNNSITNNKILNNLSGIKLKTTNTNDIKKINPNNNTNNISNNSNKLQILIVDDTETIRNSLKRLLMKNPKINSDFIIIEAKDGIELLYLLVNDQIKGNRIKMIITDENMEYMSGSSAITIIRELENQKKIKHVFISSLTAFSDEETRNEIIRKGADTVLYKPLSRSMLDDLLNDFFNKEK